MRTFTFSALLAGRLRALRPSEGTLIPLQWQERLSCAQLRFFSEDGPKNGDDAAPSGEPAAEAPSTSDPQPAADKPTESEPPKPPGPPTIPELIARGYTPRQAAHISPDPDKHKHFLPRLSRKERGAYGSEEAVEQFGQEVELYPQVPSNRPLYNLREAVPEMVQPRSVMFEQMKELKDDHPGMSLEELAARVGLTVPPASPPPPPSPGLQRILEWESRLVMSPGIVGEAHPANRKARCRVHLRALQQQAGLTEEALQHIALVAGPRYNPTIGMLTLSCERYNVREENRRHIVRTLGALVEEGRSAYPSAEQEETRLRETA